MLVPKLNCYTIFQLIKCSVFFFTRAARAMRSLNCELLVKQIYFHQSSHANKIPGGAPVRAMQCGAATQYSVLASRAAAHSSLAFNILYNTCTGTVFIYCTNSSRAHLSSVMRKYYFDLTRPITLQDSICPPREEIFSNLCVFGSCARAWQPCYASKPRFNLHMNCS